MSTVDINDQRKDEYLEEYSRQHGPREDGEEHGLVNLETGMAGREKAPSFLDAEGLRLNSEAVDGERELFLVEDAIAVDFFAGFGCQGESPEGPNEAFEVCIGGAASEKGSVDSPTLNSISVTYCFSSIVGVVMMREKECQSRVGGFAGWELRWQLGAVR